MSGPSSKLIVPTALEAANVLIIGQLTFLYANVLFELSSAFNQNGLAVRTPEQWVFVMAVLTVPPVLLVNILSCWATTRETFEEFSEYPNSLFMIDTILLVLFFFINNIVARTIGSVDRASPIHELFGAGPRERAGADMIDVLPPFLYVSSALICLVYIWWNREHRSERRKAQRDYSDAPNMVAHIRFLFFAATLQIVLCGVSLASSDAKSEAVCLAAWIVVWGWLNTQWLITSPLTLLSRRKQARPKRAAASPSSAQSRRRNANPKDTGSR